LAQCLLSCKHEQGEYDKVVCGVSQKDLEEGMVTAPQQGSNVRYSDRNLM